MLFNSYAFVFLFLPLFLISWQFASRTRGGLEFVLLFASLLFYVLFGLPWLFLLAGLICLNYLLGKALVWKGTGTPDPKAESPAGVSRRTLFIIAICLNLAPLVWFKYSWFAIRNLALLLHADWLFTPPALPLGISFYTFIQIAWLAGVYRGELQPLTLTRHAIFSSCFPYIISGPIVRYEQIGGQLDAIKATQPTGLATGFTLFSIGLAKKVLLADSIGLYADAVFNAADRAWPLTFSESWLGSFCYTFQLYFDFSGYTDMAIGLGLMIGLKFPPNFNSPYKSTGIIEFWRRWHMTLGSWLRDFLYIPMGGNRHGRWRQYRNIFLTMLIGGAWHGGGWTFIIWGAFHGGMLCANHGFRAWVHDKPCQGFFASPGCRLVFIFLTFICIDLAWVVFRATSLDGALAMYSAMFAGPITSGMPSVQATEVPSLITLLIPNHYFSSWQPFALLLACFAICWLLPNSQQILSGQNSWLAWRPSNIWATALALLTFISLVFLSRQSVFLYFRF